MTPEEHALIFAAALAGKTYIEAPDDDPDLTEKFMAWLKAIEEAEALLTGDEAA